MQGKVLCMRLKEKIMKWTYPKDMWIVLGNNKEKAIWKADQELMEQMVAEDAIIEYQQLKVLKL